MKLKLTRASNAGKLTLLMRCPLAASASRTPPPVRTPMHICMRSSACVDMLIPEKNSFTGTPLACETSAFPY